MAGYIPEDVIDEIRSRSDIVDLIGSYLPLKRAGGRYKALCPFHKEKTPSFVVSPDRQTYHCFGCGNGGNAFTFVMDREGVDFPGAVHILAARYGVIIPETSGGRAGGGERQSATAKQRLYDLMEDVCVWYQRCLKDSSAKAVAEYLSGRGIDTAAIDKFRIGASPDSWDAAKSHLVGRGYSEAEIVEAGIIKTNENGGDRAYDRFRGRLMFPIWNDQGRVVAFSARTIEKEHDGAKYINSPETALFKKSRVLYALPLARRAIRDKGFVIMCEGQLDVIAMHRAGFENAVAPQGTAFTAEQASVIKRHTDTICFSFDADSAGRKAVRRALEICLPLGLTAKVIQMPAGQDPDGIFKTGGAVAMAQMVDSAVDFFDFLLADFGPIADMSPNDKEKAVGSMVDILALVGGEVARASYLSALANRFSVREDAVFRALSRRRRNARPGAGRMDAPNDNHAATRSTTNFPLGAGAADNPRSACEELLLDAVLSNKLVADDIAAAMDCEMLSGDRLGQALEECLAMTQNGEWTAIPDFLAGFISEVPVPGISRALAKERLEGEDMGQEAADALKRLRTELMKTHLNELLELIKSGEADKDTKRQYIELTSELKRMMREQPKPLGLRPTAPDE